MAPCLFCSKVLDFDASSYEIHIRYSHGIKTNQEFALSLYLLDEDEIEEILFRLTERLKHFKTTGSPTKKSSESLFKEPSNKDKKDHNFEDGYTDVPKHEYEEKMNMDKKDQNVKEEKLELVKVKSEAPEDNFDPEISIYTNESEINDINLVEKFKKSSAMHSML